jgi:hypothetical protein
MNLEQVVRPFAPPAILSTKRIVPAPTKEASEATITWGSAGSIPQPEKIPDTGSDYILKECAQDHKMTEKERTFEIVRVHNKDDPTQFVDVARPITITFTETKAKTYTSTFGYKKSSTESQSDSSYVDPITTEGCDTEYDLDNSTI